MSLPAIVEDQLRSYLAFIEEVERIKSGEPDLRLIVQCIKEFLSTSKGLLSLEVGHHATPNAISALHPTPTEICDRHLMFIYNSRIDQAKLVHVFITHTQPSLTTSSTLSLNILQPSAISPSVTFKAGMNRITSNTLVVKINIPFSKHFLATREPMSLILGGEVARDPVLLALVDPDLETPAAAPEEMLPAVTAALYGSNSTLQKTS